MADQRGHRVRGKLHCTLFDIDCFWISIPQISGPSGEENGKPMPYQNANIDTFKKQAKRLKKAYASGDTEARVRVQEIVPDKLTLTHADFLFVIAREQGHQSWPKFKFALETSVMNKEQKADRLRSALYLGHRWIIEKLLAESPDLTSYDLGLQIATYDIEAIHKALADNPGLVTKAIKGRLPFHHLCFSHYIHVEPEKADKMLAMAQLLLDKGADFNHGMSPDFSSHENNEHTLSPLYGALGHANNMVLAEWLLRQGANPDDNESLYHATELSHHQGLKLLLKYNANPKGTNALARALDFKDQTAVQLLLDHGADPNEVAKEHPSGQPVDTIPALHQAARRQCGSDIAELLLEYNADANYIWQGHTAYALALIHGNSDFADTLSKAGYAHALTPNEVVLASCSRGRPTGKITEELEGEDRLLITKLITEPDRLDHVKSLVAAGLDINQTDAMGLSPLHAACWAGLPDQVSYLLEFDPDLEQLNNFGGNAFHTTLHGASNCPERKQRDHISCVRLLLEAGAKLDPRDIQNVGSENMALFLEDWLDNHPTAIN
ncbi:ankyrin repeat domain-containing protein [uncultured Kiloniella sp.]|uniref:ankyrin repeat domain-containing protein n=1 Tax=uncultured Kiloniella sp. TaxID=1133091 RepID=UPI0026221A03|nr:ankyrin repeat domain-containing protein [uncultured Kiloniella sp.]